MAAGLPDGAPGAIAAGSKARTEDDSAPAAAAASLPWRSMSAASHPRASLSVMTLPGKPASEGAAEVVSVEGACDGSEDEGSREEESAEIGPVAGRGEHRRGKAARPRARLRTPPRMLTAGSRLRVPGRGFP